MSCNNKKTECATAGCSNKCKQSAPPKTMDMTQTPVEALLSAPEIGQIFLDLVQTGVKKFDFVDQGLQALAFQITGLLAENKHLRKLLGAQRTDNPEINVNAENITIAFGPNNAYTLQLPVRDNCAVFANQLRAIANMISPEHDPQLNLFER